MQMLYQSWFKFQEILVSCFIGAATLCSYCDAFSHCFLRHKYRCLVLCGLYFGFSVFHRYVGQFIQRILRLRGKSSHQQQKDPLFLSEILVLYWSLCLSSLWTYWECVHTRELNQRQLERPRATTSSSSALSSSQDHQIGEITGVF